MDSRVTTQIMTVPAYVLACVFTLTLAVSSDRFQERGFHGVASTTMACLGYVLLVLTRECSVAARYVSLIICTCGVYSFVPLLLSWPCSNIGGHTKKGVSIAAIISFAQIGSVIGGQVYREDDGEYPCQSQREPPTTDRERRESDADTFVRLTI